MVKKYKKKPIVIEAVQFTGYNDLECRNFCPDAHYPDERGPSLLITTLEGEMRCDIGDWIIKGVKSEFYPCKPDIFKQTYEEVSNGAGGYY